MSDLAIEIAELLDEGLEPGQVAYRLGIPLDWVLGVVVGDTIDLAY